LAQVKLCRADDVTEGEPFQAVVAGHKPFAVFRLGEEIFVTQDECTHATASLSLEGTQEGAHIVCSWHEATFDVRTGLGISGPCEKPLQSFPVTLSDGDVLIEV